MKYVALTLCVGLFFPMGVGAGFIPPLLDKTPESNKGWITPEQVIGCYELGVLKWPHDLGEDNVFITPPVRIEIMPEKGSKGFEVNGYLVRPAPGVSPSIHRASYWRPTGKTTIEIVWTTGFSGLSMKLHVEREALKGKAKPFWDFPRWGQTAHVLAHKIDCGRNP
jgi:hypothetical protein